MTASDTTPVPAAPGRFRSWGRYPPVERQWVVPLAWQSDVPRLDGLDRSVLAYGLGRSYGDACLNEGGILLATRGLDRFIAFDRERGVLRCEAGVTVGEVLRLVLPHGWTLPVVPGTQHVTVGGALANDVHGKNHHRAGSFGCHVRRFALLRSDGARYECSPTSHGSLFAATIGGLGLTGLVLWVELTLSRVASPWLDVRRGAFGSIDEWFELADSWDRVHEYTVAWVDTAARGRSVGRGILLAADHASGGPAGIGRRPLHVRVPVDAPSFLLNRASIAGFNRLYYAVGRRRRGSRLTAFEPFFFPLDRLADWNRLYGRRGFVQYQLVVPDDAARDALRAVLSTLDVAGARSFLSVLKRFGRRRSPGLLSFPRPGVTLSLDFPHRGRPTLDVLRRLDDIVADAGGALYPAKDARMSPAMFQRSFPQLPQFVPHRDVQFSSSFWRRVTATTPERPR